MFLKRIVSFVKNAVGVLDFPFTSKVVGFSKRDHINGTEPLMFIWGKDGYQKTYAIVLNKHFWTIDPTRQEIRHIFMTAVNLGHVPISIEFNRISYFLRDYCPEFLVMPSGANQPVTIVRNHGFG